MADDRPLICASLACLSCGYLIGLLRTRPPSTRAFMRLTAFSGIRGISASPSARLYRSQIHLYLRAMSSSTSKPRVLLLGDNYSPKATMDKLHSLAEVHSLPPGDHEEASEAIAQAVKEHGPFVAFGVRLPLFLCSIVDSRICAHDRDTIPRLNTLPSHGTSRSSNPLDQSASCMRIPV